MSYILEALKKADQERGLGAVPNLATPHEVKQPQTRSYRWLWVVATLLAVNAVLVVMLLQGREAEAPATVQVPPEQRLPLANDTSAQAIQPSGEVAISATPSPEANVLAEKAPTPPAGELVLLPEPATLQDFGPSSLPEERPDQRAETSTAAMDTPQLRSWYELPLEFRNKLDVPRLDLHAYSEDPQNRFILVNLRKYREGERLESGMVLEEILPDGMVMSYQGERFFVEK